MFLRCSCGYTLTDIASPGRIVHHLLSAHGVERLQDAIDREVEAHGVVDEWPEHWETAGAAESWLCPQCSRLYVGMNGAGPVRVFALERVGVDAQATGIDSQLASMPELLALAQEQAGESPLCRKHAQSVMQPDQPGDTSANPKAP
jgi:hypothetical protein